MGLGAADIIFGPHGAGLANVLFVREGAVLIELKSDYGLTAFEYRKFIQTVHGGFAAIRVRSATPTSDVKKQGVEVTDETALIVHECIAALQVGDPQRCARLPWVMQVWPIGHDADCFFRDWTLQGRRRTARWRRPWRHRTKHSLNEKEHVLGVCQ